MWVRKTTYFFALFVIIGMVSYFHKPDSSLLPQYTNIEIDITTGTLSSESISVYAGDQIKYKVTWYNQHAFTQTINNFSVSCGCTFPDVKLPVEVKAYESVTIPILLNTQGKRGSYSESITAFNNNESILWELILNGEAVSKISIPNPVITKIITNADKLVKVEFGLTSQFDDELSLSIEGDNEWNRGLSGDTQITLKPRENRFFNIEFPVDEISLPEYIKFYVVENGNKIAMFSVQLLGNTDESI